MMEILIAIALLGGLGLGFGLVLGFAAVAAAEVLYRFTKKRIFHV